MKIKDGTGKGLCLRDNGKIDLKIDISSLIDKKSGITSSRFAQLFLVDTLYTAIANRDYENIREYLKDSYEVFNDIPKD